MECFRQCVLWWHDDSANVDAAVDDFLEEQELDSLLDFFCTSKSTSGNSVKRVEPLDGQLDRPTDESLDDIYHIVMIDGENQHHIAPVISALPHTHIILYAHEDHPTWRKTYGEHIITQKTASKNKDACDFFMAMDIIDILHTYPKVQLISIWSNDHFTATVRDTVKYMGYNQVSIQPLVWKTQGRSKAILKVRKWEDKLGKQWNFMSK